MTTIALKINAFIVNLFLASSAGLAFGQTSNIDCSKARDYDGCIKYQGSRLKPAEIYRQPVANDFLGMPPIAGWNKQELPHLNSIIYTNPTIFKVKVRGSYGRYVHQQSLVRRFRNPVAAVKGSSTILKGESTTCETSAIANRLYPFSGIAVGSSSTRCRTTPAVTLDIPGRDADPGGISQIPLDTILDCDEKTVGSHWDGSLKGGWQSIDNLKGNSYESFVLLESCARINNLQPSSFSNYE